MAPELAVADGALGFWQVASLLQLPRLPIHRPFNCAT